MTVFGRMMPIEGDIDPEVPVLQEQAKILNIDRVASPYSPQSPRYIQQGLTWESFQPLLLEAGI